MNDYYRYIMDHVCRVTGFSEWEILHDRKQLCVDARYLLVHFLSKEMPCHEIVHYSGLSKQCVSQVMNLYADRLRYTRSLQVSEHELTQRIQESTDMLCPPSVRHLSAKQRFRP